jgi:MYXO-CTERM domain-containing protein
MSVLTLIALSQPAAACGGFFCSNTDVDQSAERILFAKNEELGEVEAHVQIFFQGSAEEFAWVVPTPDIPELFLSSDQIFSVLEAATAPRFVLEYEEVDECEDDRWWGYDDAFSASSSPAPEAGGGVNVVAEEEVGPYETVILQARTSDDLLTWLQDNDFDLPDDLSPALDPYVAEQSYFVAMRLANDKSAGDIQPLGMRYPSEAISIPIQLTSIAATPDMRVETYVLGDYRAVPESYLHVRINEAAIDWFGGGWNYEDVISQAADEAGGHAFATDYAGPSSVVGSGFDTSTYDLDAIAEAATPGEAMEQIMWQFPANGLLLSILSEFMPPPEGVDAQSFYNCVQCYELGPDYEWDPAGLADALDERILAPLDHADELFSQHPALSRLTSSLDAIEMTVDPTFVLNADMNQSVSNLHEAKVLMYCGDGGSWRESSRELLLPDGRSVRLPSEQWLEEQGLTEYEFMSGLTDKAALVIEQTSSSGEPIVIADYNAWADDEAADISTEAYLAEAGEPEEAKGCGCSSTSSGSVAGVLGLLGLVGLRRRR